MSDLRAEPGEEAAGMRIQNPREAPHPSPRCRKETPILGSHPVSGAVLSSQKVFMTFSVVNSPRNLYETHVIRWAF